MRRSSWKGCSLFALACVAAHATHAHAQAAESAEPELSAQAHVAPPVTASAGEDPTASMTALDVSRADPGSTLAQALAPAPGARVSSSGGLGAYTTLALRGAEPEHTSVMFDTIPLDGVDSGAFDLSTLPLAAFERIEVYRGGAPAWISQGAIGGTLRLLPARGTQRFARLSLGGGSFGRRLFAATTSVDGAEAPRPSLLAHAALQGADNDYAYRDDVLAFDDRDGATLRQRNADIAAGDLALHAGVDLAGGRLVLLSLGHGHSGGLPGVLSSPTRDSHRSYQYGLAGVSWEREARGPAGARESRVQLLAAVGAARDRVSDPFGELRMGIPTEGDDVLSRLHARAAGSLRVTPWLEPTLVASVTQELRSPSDDANFSAPPRASRRTTEAFAIEPRLHGAIGELPAELRPSARIELSQARLDDERTAAGARAQRDVAAATFRLAASLQPSAGLLVGASAASGTRVPTIWELFGDRAALAPSPDLKPERSRMLDASVVLGGRDGALHGRAELRPFLSWMDELIRYRRIDEGVAKAENVDHAQIAGVELGVDGGLQRWLSLAAALTILHTESALGFRLPLRPAIDGYVRPEIAVPLPRPMDRARIFVEAHHVSRLYLDDASAGDPSLPARTLLAAGAGLDLLEGRLALDARVSNLLDDAARDLLARPLPGRELLVVASLREELP